MDFKREELGKYSLLEMDLDAFRTEPVVGLSYITEVQCIFGIRCICHLCGIMFSHIGGQDHVTSAKHRLRYLREKWPEDYEYICQRSSRSAQFTVMLHVLRNAENADGRGRPSIYVFEGKPSGEESSSNSSHDSEAVKMRQAFGDFVNQELQAAKQKSTDDVLPFGFGSEGSTKYSEDSTYVELWDLQGESESFFDENITVESSGDFGWEFPEARGSAGGADTKTDSEHKSQATLGLPKTGDRRILEPDREKTADGTAGAASSHHPLNLKARDVSGPSSNVPTLCSGNEGNKEQKEAVGKEMSKENNSNQKSDNQQGSDGNKMPKQETNDEKNTEGVMTGNTTKSKTQETSCAEDVDEAAALLDDPNRTQFFCCYCDFRTLSRSEFADHVKRKSHSDLRQYCDFRTLSRSEFADHVKRKSHSELRQKFLDNKRIYFEPGVSRIMFQRHELGTFSYLKKHLETHSKESILGLSFVTEHQHTTTIRCICHLCGTSFIHRNAEAHLIGYIHRMRYLREKSPQIYADLCAKGTTKKQIMVRLNTIVKVAERKDGRGTPVIQVYGGNEDSKNESDNQKQDSCTGADEQNEDVEPSHFEFVAFVRKEHEKEKLHPREPVIFEYRLPKPDPSDEPYLADPYLRNPHPPHHLPPGPHPFIGRPPPHMERPPPHMERTPPHMERPPYADPHFPKRPIRPDPYFRGRDPYYMRMRADPYADPFLDPDPLKRMRRDDPYLDPDPLKRMRRDEPYLDPDPLKRMRRDEPYLDPDPLKRMRQSEPQLDPDPLKRRTYGGSYLDRDPLKRIKFDEPYIDPDPLKRVLPSQKAAKKSLKPVVIDYGHGSEKKSAKNTADQWERDIKDILNDSKAPDSLAQLSCSYSSPKKEESSPPPQAKRELPFSRSYMDKSKELQKKLSSSKKDRSRDFPDREKSRGRHRLGSPSRRYKRSRSPLSVKDRSRGKVQDPVRRDRTDSSPRRQRHSKSPDIKDSASRRYKRSKSPEDFRLRSNLKDKDQTYMKRSRSRSPVKEETISSSRENKDVSPQRKKSYGGKDLPTSESKKPKSPERFDLRTKFRDKERGYEMMKPTSTNPENRVVSPQKKISHEKPLYSNQPEASTSSQKGSIQSGMFIDLTSDDEISLPSGKEIPSAHTSVEKPPPKEEPKPSTSNAVDEAQADLIAEMLLKMKTSLIGQDADPRSALKALLSQDMALTKVLLATKELGEKESPPKQVRQDERSRDSLERYKEEKAGSSERHFDLKSKDRQKPPSREKDSSPKVKQMRQDERSRDSLERYKEEKAGSSERHFELKSKDKPKPPPREKVVFSFAGRSKASGQLTPQVALHFPDEDDEDEI